MAAVALNDLVNNLRDPLAGHAVDAGDDLADAEQRLRHDLRTPLNAIIGYSEMVGEDLAEHPGVEALRQDIDRLLGEARRLLDSIDAIVNLTRAEPAPPGSDDEAEQINSVRDVVAGLLHTLRPREVSKPQEVGRILIVDDEQVQSRRTGTPARPRRP